MALGGCHDDFSCSLHPVGYNPHFLCVAAGGPIRPTMEEVQEKIQRERNVLGACLQLSAKRLDYRKSDPLTIARGVLSACGTEFQNLVTASSPSSIGLTGRQGVEAAGREAFLDA